MNIHIVVEGEIGEKQVYKHWVPLVNPNLSFVTHISNLVHNNFSIVIGGGYPQYFEIIDAAIADVNSYGNVDRLVLVVDSEEMEYDEKLAEINHHISNIRCKVEIHIIVQHFCLEAWALGNQAIIRKNPRSLKLREYKRYYDVRHFDPELLPDYPLEELNRAQFAEKYLRRALNDNYRNLTYSKSNPEALLHDKYFERVKTRFIETNHIASFENFLSAFQ